MNMNILAVDVKHMSTFDFLKEGETEIELLERANEYKKNVIEAWANNCINYPCEQYENYLKAAKEKEYTVITWSEFEKLQKDFYIGGEAIETTEENFEDMLNCLPPLKWCTIDEVEMFCMSEMLTGTYTDQYSKYQGKYYTKIVDITDKNTWINNYLVA